MEWPGWWEWEVDISSHCAKRMQERVFNEADLRAILSDASDLMDQSHGTYLVVSTHEGRRWEAIVVPDFEKQIIVVVTAYPVS